MAPKPKGKRVTVHAHTDKGAFMVRFQMMPEDDVVKLALSAINEKLPKEGIITFTSLHAEWGEKDYKRIRASDARKHGYDRFVSYWPNYPGEATF